MVAVIQHLIVQICCFQTYLLAASDSLLPLQKLKPHWNTINSLCWTHLATKDFSNSCFSRCKPSLQARYTRLVQNTDFSWSKFSFKFIFIHSFYKKITIRWRFWFLVCAGQYVPGHANTYNEWRNVFIWHIVEFFSVEQTKLGEFRRQIVQRPPYEFFVLQTLVSVVYRKLLQNR